MAKETYYFSHDYGSRNDPKLQKLLMRLGQHGKGVYWDLIEMLYEQGGYLLLSECDSYAFALRTECECITSVIRDFFLFENDGVKFWSESVLRRLNKRTEKSEKAANSAKKRWNNANALQTQYDSNAKKGKERKGNNKEIYKEKFELCRTAYPNPHGKMGLETEFNHFVKKHKDWIEVIDLLLPAINKQVKHKQYLVASGAPFVAEWKNFRTWINQRCWEEETPEHDNLQPQKQITHTSHEEFDEFYARKR